jgi:hypothetical protein
MSFQSSTNDDRWGTLKDAVLAVAALAVLALFPRPAEGQSPQTIRSTSDAMPVRGGRIDQPYWRETQSHRGWEIREPQYVVFAATSKGDAAWAAGHVQQAWINAARLADRWTDAHRQPGFGLGSTQVVIDNDPPRERDGPLTTVNVVGVQTQVYLNVSPGQPTLRQQVLRLRAAAAFAMLHTAGLDGATPPWVAQGLAANLGGQGLDPVDAKAAEEVKLAARFGGQQWRFTRSGQDKLADPGIDEPSAASSIKFLLEGDDAQHASALLAEIETAWKKDQQAAAEGGQFLRQPGDGQPVPTNTSFDQLLAQLKSQYDAWRNDPLAGQPVFEPDQSLSPDLLRAEQEMLVVLKLQRKLSPQSLAGGARSRVATFDRDQGRQILVASAGRTAPASIFEFAERLSDPAAKPVATLDVDGSLLLSSDIERIAELLDRPGERYAFASRGEQVVLVRRLEGGGSLQGWLERNPNQPARPLARFELVNGQSRSKIQSRPTVQDARLP